jgi:phage baseplate assembly protein W
MVDVPHFRFPFAIGAGGTFEVIEQDSEDDIGQCVQVLLSTEVGSRVELPEYGIEDPTFTTRIDTPGIISAIQDWEPRADVTMDEQFDSVDAYVRHVRTNVSSAGVVTE